MLGEFLLRLAVALPIICGLAALSLYATKRGWLRLPSLMTSGTSYQSFVPQSVGRQPAAVGAAAPLTVLSVKSLSPAARIAVVRFAGRDLLVGVSGQGVSLLAEASSTPTKSPSPLEEIAR